MMLLGVIAPLAAAMPATSLAQPHDTTSNMPTNVRPDDRQLALDRQIAARIDELAAQLDTASAAALTRNERFWRDWLDTLPMKAKRLGAREDEVAELMVEARTMRLSFLDLIDTDTHDDLRGGWSDGVQEMLLDINASGGAKLMTTGEHIGEEKSVCVIEGTATQVADGFDIALKGMPDTTVQLRRNGLALSVDVPAGEQAVGSYCTIGGRIAGEYFYLPNSEELVPWLLG